MHRLISLVILSVLLIASTAWAATLGSITFESGTYSPWTTGGATHTNLPSGGWDGNGAAQFTVPTSADSYSGISLNFTNSDEVYIRWVQFTEANFHDTSDFGKAMIVLSTNGTSNRGIVIDHACSGTWTDLTVCAEIECQYNNTQPDCEQSYDCPPRAWNSHDVDGEWAAYEVYMNRTSGVGWIKATDRDGDFNEYKTTVCDTDNLASAYDYTEIQILGTYGGVGGGTFILDDLVVADSPIGPPTGFILGTTSNINASGSFTIQ